MRASQIALGLSFLRSAPGSIAASKALTAAANALVLVIGTRVLNAEQFGVFGAVLAATVLLGRLLVLGCDYGYLRLRELPEFAGEDEQLAGAGIAVLAISSFVAVMLAIPVSTAMQSGTAAIAAAVVASLGWGCAEYGYWLFLAHNEYGKALLAQAGTAITRAAIMFAFALLFEIQTSLLLITYSVSGLLLGGCALLLGTVQYARLPRLSVINRLLRYSYWQGLAQTVTALAGYQATFLLLMAGKPAESGRFSLALVLLTGVFLVYQGLLESLTLDVVKLRHVSEFAGFLRGAVRQAVTVVFGCGLFLVVIAMLAPIVFTSALWAEGAVFLPMALASLLVLLHAPFEASCHYFLAPAVVFKSRLVRLILVSVLGLAFAVSHGALHLAWVQLGSTAASLLYVATVVLRRQRHTERERPLIEAVRGIGL